MDKSLLNILDFIVMEYVKYKINYEKYRNMINEVIDNYIEQNKIVDNEIKHLRAIISDNYIIEL